MNDCEKIIVASVAYPPNGNMIVDIGVMTAVFEFNGKTQTAEAVANFVEWEINQFLIQNLLKYPVSVRGVYINRDVILLFITPWTHDIEDFFSQDISHTASYISKLTKYTNCALQ